MQQWIFLIPFIIPASYDNSVNGYNSFNYRQANTQKPVPTRALRNDETSTLDFQSEKDHLDAQKIGDMPNVGDLIKKMKKKFKNVYPENLYEPYWQDGDWVYSRGTMPHDKRFKHKTRSTWNLTSTQPIRTRDTTEMSRTPYVDLDCQHPCPFIFEQYGPVCGQRYNGLEYEMKEFLDICDLIADNCINPVKEKAEFKMLQQVIDYYDGQRRGEWRVLHRGYCWELVTPFVYIPTKLDVILSKASYLDMHIREIKKLGVPTLITRPRTKS